MKPKIAGVLRESRLLNPAANTSSVKGAGGSFNMNLDLTTDLHFVLNNFYNDGGGPQEIRRMVTGI